MKNDMISSRFFSVYTIYKLVALFSRRKRIIVRGKHVFTHNFQGGFVVTRHNRDLEANLIKQVHIDVEVEPHFQPINGENINGFIGDKARSETRARSVWRNGHNAFFDIRVTNINANSQNHLASTRILERLQKEKNASAIIVS